MEDNERLRRALVSVVSEDDRSIDGIGTLGEKTVHRALKYYYEPDPLRHEVELLGSVADAFDGSLITEIQSAGFSYLVPKLRRFLPKYSVRVVYPLVVKKILNWVECTGGDVVGKGREVKGKVVADVGRELMQIAEFIPQEGLSVHILCLECDEYRLLDGFGPDKKRKATRLNILPRRVVCELRLERTEDYLCLLPCGLGEEFTAKDFQRLCGSRSRYSYYTLRLLCTLGLLSRRKDGREYIYSKTTKD